MIKEAMACGLPVVVTDRCGSLGDIGHLRRLRQPAELPKHYAMCDAFVLPSLYEPRTASAQTSSTSWPRGAFHVPTEWLRRAG